MAIKLLTVNDVYNIREAKYIVDEENEKDLIPDEDKIQGTKVLVIKGSKEYRMDSAGNWVEITTSGGGSGGSDLPDVTAADNGKVLGVVSGVWDKMNASDGLPDYSEASDGDVLAIENGAPAWKESSGGAWDKWNEQMKEITFVEFEATSKHTIDVLITCSDGYAQSSWENYYDPEIGEYRPYWNEWTSDEDLPAIPNLENYITTLEWNIGLILEAAYAETHDWSQAQNLPNPAIVCRSWKSVWE